MFTYKIPNSKGWTAVKNYWCSLQRFRRRWTYGDPSSVLDGTYLIESIFCCLSISPAVPVATVIADVNINAYSAGTTNALASSSSIAASAPTANNASARVIVAIIIVAWTDLDTVVLLVII